MMLKKILAFSLCVLLTCSMVACNGSPKEKETTQSEQETSGESAATEESQEPLLDSDATDEDLLELIKDDINVVADQDFDKTVAEIKENTSEFSGKIYQMTGIYKEDGTDSYITSESAESDDPAESGLLLRYLTEKPQDGTQIKVTAVVNTDDSEEEGKAVLDVIVSESLN